MTARLSPTLYATLFSLLLSSGCGWVDATGRQGTDAPQTAPSPDTPVALSTSVPLEIVEQQTRLLRLDGEDTQLSGWRWRTLDAPGDPQSCAFIDGFDPTLAANTLATACSDPNACSLTVAESRDASGALFALSLPALRAPVAALVALRANADDGRLVERQHTLCGISVNEAPEAEADRYAVNAGFTLRVDATDGDSLIANDSDDNDVRNSPLTIDRQPARAPRFAEFFELGDDGSFIYRTSPDVLKQASGILEDSFAYTLRDGLFEVVAEVTIEISDGEVSSRNEPPVALSELPNVEYVVDPLFGVEVRLNLASRFFDPDGDRLVFTVRPGSFPPGSSLELSRDGILFGRLSASDFGSWRVSVIVDDGQASIERDFTLRVVRIFEANRAPIASDISNRVVRGSFTYDVAPYFDDPDGDRLRFSAQGLPVGVSISPNGVISGRSLAQNSRSWIIVVTASDTRGGSVSDGFRLTIQ